MFNLGPLEIVVVLTAVMLIFGPKRLPELAKGVGKGIRDFKKALAGVDEESQQVGPPEPITENIEEKSPDKVAAKT